MQTILTITHAVYRTIRFPHLTSLQRKAILYLAIIHMTNHAEDICGTLHMAKVFPCLFPMGKTDNHNYTRNNDKITLFISLIQQLQTIKRTNY